MYRSVVLSIFFLLVSSVPLQAQEANELQGRATYRHLQFSGELSPEPLQDGYGKGRLSH